jgi:CxxC-x17-CxxC domain-containing protein
MNNFKFGNRSRGRDSFGGRGVFGGGDRRDSGRPAMHDAVCDDCGRDCQVPFRPSGEKPIYCSDCFEKRGGNDRGGDRSNSRNSYDRPRFETRDFVKPVQSQTANVDVSRLTKNIENLNNKLDIIISLLGNKNDGVSKSEKKEKSVVIKKSSSKKPVKISKASKVLED